jgi:phosphoglycerate dehydrogenase-like enzyme
MSGETPRYTVLIASYLEPELVERIRQVDRRLEVLFEPDLLGAPRFASDHTSPHTRTPAEEARWRQLLARADILFDFDVTHRQDLPDLAPRVRWIQATSAGIGQTVKRWGYDTRMPETVFTTASGAHVRPLAEFVVMALLMHYRGARRILRDQQRKHWELYATTDLEGRAVAIVGLGRIGAGIARACRALGMTVIGTNVTPLHEVVDRYYATDRLHEMLAQAEVLVLSVPHTPRTEKMIGARELALLPRGAFVINVGRGAVVDEPALIEALGSGRLGGAALDVFAEEPLPPGSPLWEMPNVLVSPHSASTSDRENARIVDLFCENLRRFLGGAPLRNVLDVERMY